jgi:hypothetical protein
MRVSINCSWSSTPIEPDGRFHLVWTTSWTAEHEKVFGYSSSTNLIDWFRSRDLETWEDCTGELSFPPGHRHGTVLRIPPDLGRQLTQR